MNIGVLGGGRFGSHLAHSLRKLGHGVQVLGHDQSEQTAQWVKVNAVLCLACRDDQLTQLITQFKPHALTRKTVLIHSGATPLSVLLPLQERGAVIGKFHPLMAFTRVEDAPIPQGTPFAYEGDIAPWVAPWVEAWGGKLYPLTGAQWQTYHLAAVVAANFLPLFIREGASLLAPITGTGSEGDALDWLAPLLRTTLAAALDRNNPRPYAGPAVRGDAQVLQLQEKQLREDHPALAELYRQISALISAKKT